MRILKKHMRPFLEVDCICKRVTRQNYYKRESLNHMVNEIIDLTCKNATYQTCKRIAVLMRKKIHSEISEEGFVCRSQALLSNSAM